MRIPAIIQLHMIVLMWGFTSIMGKLISLNSIPLVWGRILIAASLIFIYLRFFTREKIYFNQKIILQLLACGVVVGIHWMLFYEAIKISNISIATSALSTGTLFVAILEPIFLRRKLRISEIILSIVIIICILFIFNTEISYYKGIILGILCAFFSALFTVLNGIMYKKGAPSVITFYELVGGLFIVTICMTIQNDWLAIVNIRFTDIIGLFILGGLLTSFPMIRTIGLMKNISPFTLMLSINLEPVYAIIIAFFIWQDSEKMSLTFYLATLTMILAICINGYLKAKYKQKQLK